MVIERFIAFPATATINFSFVIFALHAYSVKRTCLLALVRGSLSLAYIFKLFGKSVMALSISVCLFVTYMITGNFLAKIKNVKNYVCRI